MYAVCHKAAFESREALIKNMFYITWMFLKRNFKVESCPFLTEKVSQRVIEHNLCLTCPGLQNLTLLTRAVIRR